MGRRVVRVRAVARPFLGSVAAPDRMRDYRPFPAAIPHARVDPDVFLTRPPLTGSEDPIRSTCMHEARRQRSS